MREVGANILKITIPLEKEVAAGTISIETAAEIARIEEPEVQQQVIDYAKREGLTRRKAQFESICQT